MAQGDDGALGRVRFVFDGREADKHFIDARQMGKSLIGIDRAVNVGLILLAQGRMPRQRERFDFYVAAKSPVQGSVDIPTVIQNVPWLLPLVHEFLVAHGADYVKNFLSWMLLWHGGRKSEAEVYMDKMLDIVKEVNRSHQSNTESWQHTLLSTINQLAPAARDIVAPVGRTAGRLTIDGDAPESRTTIDEPIAEAIRSKEDIELQDKVEMTIRIDGIIRHSKTLKVEHPNEPGRFLTADVRDPEFDTMPNVYTEAFSAKQEIKVLARPALRNGELFKIYVMEAVA